MKKVGIVTICDNNNYGNRLQNYATQEFCIANNLKPETIKNKSFFNDVENKNLKYYLRRFKSYVIEIFSSFNKRNRNFKEFNKNILFSKSYYHNWSNKEKNNYDLFFVGSDQVWNPNFNRLKKIDLLGFADPKQRISFSASFGISDIPTKYKEIIKSELNEFKAISVREESGKKIIEELTGRKNVTVLLDPTMLIEEKKWDEVMKKPKMMEKIKGKKYILNYFLGNLSEVRKKEIERIAKENDCEIINILDKNDAFYSCGPSEFLYLEKNAFLICTDSFHSSVFAILFERPFVVFDRENSKIKMSSRIETLLKKFNLEDRWFENHIKDNQILVNYNVKEILKIERKKAKEFIEEAIK